MEHHAYVLAGDNEENLAHVFAFVKKEFGVKVSNNPDVITLRFSLFSVDDARRVIELANQAPLTEEGKAIIIVAKRIYHEAQNALLKLFEEPPVKTTLFLVVPTLGQLIPTLRSRVAVLGGAESVAGRDSTKEFFLMSKEKRSAFIKKLASGTDEEERRENRDEALALLDDIEHAAYVRGVEKHKSLLQDIAVLRGHLHDRSAPVKLILEHVALMMPKNLL